MLTTYKTTVIQICIFAGLLASEFSACAGNRFGMGRSVGRAPVSGVPHSPSGAAPLAPSSPSVPTAPNKASPVAQPAQSSQSSQSAPNVPASPSQISSPTTPIRQTPTPSQAQQLSNPNQRGFMGSLMGGVATGLGISWLMHSMGWGQQGWDAGGLDEAIGYALLTLLGAFALIIGLRKIKSARQGTIRESHNNSFARNSSSRFDGAGTATHPAEFQNYKAKNVGNDASARPWEGYAADSAGAYQSGAMPHYSGVPAGFDVSGFVTTAKQVFMTLQDAWDRSDMSTLHKMLTDQMLGEIKAQLNERELHANAGANQTDVVTLQAELLGIEESQTEYTASVEFSGLIKEDPTQGPSPFREVWSLCRPKDGSTGWLVSGVQALQ